MFWLLLFGLGALAFAGPMDKGTLTGGADDTPKPPGISEWIENGMHFAYENATGKTTAELALPDGTMKVWNVGTYDTLEEAMLASKSWLPPAVTEPDKPKPPIPTPTPEGAGAPAQPQACEIVKADGQYSICLYPQAGGYGFRATDPSGTTVATSNGYPSRGDALVGAWQMLLPFPVSVVPTPDNRHGLVLKPDGSVELKPSAKAAYYAKAVPVLQAQLNKGELDPEGLILAVFGAVWPNVNLLRLKPSGGTLAAAGIRAAPFVGDAQAFADHIFVAQANIALPQPQAPSPGAVGAGVELSSTAEILNYQRPSDGSSWWIVTTHDPYMTPGGDASTISTWRVWGPATGPGPHIVGAPAAEGETGSRPQSLDAAKVWIGTH